VSETDQTIVVLGKEELRVKHAPVEIVSVGIPGPEGVPGWKRFVLTPAFQPALAINWLGVDEVRVTLTGDFAPTFSGAINGQRVILEVKQDGAGERLVTLPANVRMSTDIPAFVASTAPNAADKIGFIYDESAARYDLVAFIKGF
jgi:hypothetical protein